jgi:hypothetical protein
VAPNPFIVSGEPPSVRLASTAGAVQVISVQDPAIVYGPDVPHVTVSRSCAGFSYPTAHSTSASNPFIVSVVPLSTKLLSAASVGSVQVIIVQLPVIVYGPDVLHAAVAI